MRTIRTKQFQVLTDINMAWDFLVEMYNTALSEGKGSIEAPFFEYALTSAWMNKNYLYLSRFWLEEDLIVGFVFYENLTDIYFVLRPGYEELAEEMVVYAKAELNYELPEGFHFVDPAAVDPVKLARCTWKGFNEWELGPFVEWDVPNERPDWTPHKSYTDVIGNVMAPPPHCQNEYDVEQYSWVYQKRS